VASEVWLLVDRVPLEQGAIVVLGDRESRHAAGPLRLRSGDTVTVTDGRGRVAEVAMRVVSPRRSEAELVAVREVEPPQGPGVTVALAVLHGQAMDWAIQKAVEVGVASFVPVCTERSQVRPLTARGRLGRWRRIARQAIKQCHRPWQMVVAEPCLLEELISTAVNRRGSVADAGGQPLATLGDSPPDLLLVGPEGGFGPSDRQLLDGTDWPKVRLGEHVLRAETAVVVGGALLVAAHRPDRHRRSRR
jgi:16S rRNA (uracil1498-N3)-methyltransferase